MSQASSIEWTDATWNPVRGCTKVSPGCKNCYAETFAERWRGIPGHPYEQGFDLRLVPEKLAEPLSWKKPRLVFVNSMSDLFHRGVPNEYIAAVFGVMAATPWNTYQVLTKRADRLPGWFDWIANQHNGPSWACSYAATWDIYDANGKGDDSPFSDEQQDTARFRPWPLPNVWLGVSVENQECADERIPYLLRTPAAVRFVSAEPLLEHIDFEHLDRGAKCERCSGPVTLDARDGTERCGCGHVAAEDLPGLDWAIIGGESGPKARPFAMKWARSMIAQLRAAKVATFFKQTGARTTTEADELVRFKKKDSSDLAKMPEWARVREWPAARLNP
jgi:protein gp37